MEIIVRPTPEDASLIAARHVARVVRDKPDAVLGLATGVRPLTDTPATCASRVMADFLL